MNKRIINFIIVATLAMPGLISAFEQKQNGITLKVSDYAQKTASVMGYTPDGALTAEKFLAQGIHPVRITIKNDTDKPVMISGRSARLKFVTPEEGAQLLHQDSLMGVPAWGHHLGRYALGALFGKYVFDLFALEIYGVPVFSTIGFICLWRSQNNLNKKEEALTKLFKDLSAQEELRYPDVIQPGKKITKLLLVDERIKKNRMFEFFVFDEKHEEIITKFDIKLV